MTATRVVVRAPNWLGDLVMALPALAALAEHQVDGTLAIAAPAAHAPVIDAARIADEILPLAADRGVVGALRSGDDVDALRRGGFDVAILLTNSFASALQMRRAGVPERWGFATDLRRPLLTRAVARPRAGRQVLHQSAVYRALLEALDIPAAPRSVGLDVPESARERGRALLGARGWPKGALLVGIAPGAAYGHAKRWPPEAVAALIDALGARDVWSVLVGSPGDRPTGLAIESAIDRRGGRAGRSRLVNLIGATDLAGLLGVLAACRVGIANDSGAMHVASAIGVPVMAIFGPTDERATAPLGPHVVLSEPVWCRPCLLRECPLDHRCMTRLHHARVLAAVLGRLDGAGDGAGRS